MDAADYEAIYDNLNSRASELMRKREALEAELGDLTKEIESLESALNDLAPLAGYVFNPLDIRNLGITQAVYTVLSNEERMSVAEIKAKMEERGFDFSSYSAPQASLHTILKRFVDANKATVEREGYSTFYRGVDSEMDKIPF